MSGLATLLRLRKLRADLARADLGEALRAEAAAEAARTAAQLAPGSEGGKLGGEVNSIDLRVLAAAYASWLPEASAAIARRNLAAETAASVRRQAGEEAASCKGALEAVELLMAARLDTVRRRALRKAQIEMDALGARVRRDAPTR